MKKNRVAAVLIVLFVIATALIVQKKHRVNTSSDNAVSQSDSPSLTIVENRTRVGNIEHMAGNQAVTKANTSNSEDLLDPEFQEMIDEAVRKATSDMKDELRRQAKGSYQERWYRKTYLLTKERLKNTDKPQTVHGKIGFQQLYESLSEPAVIVATLNDVHFSCSMIVDGAYSLGQLEPGTYEIYLNETSKKTPGIWVHSVEIKEEQSSLPINFELGTASVSVMISDEQGNPVESNDVDLLIGGTADDIHTWKKAKGLKQGLWEVDYLYKGQYFVKAVWDGKTVGRLCDLADGRNEIQLSFEKSNTQASPESHSEHGHEHHKSYHNGHSQDRSW